MTYPTKEEARKANRIQICRWYRYLPSAKNLEEQEVMNVICEKYKDMGGFNTAISKAVGWKKS